MNLDFLFIFLNGSIRDMKADIQELYSEQNAENKLIITRLNNRLTTLDRYAKAYSAYYRYNGSLNLAHSLSEADDRNASTDARAFTVTELTQYNGNNGEPAYIAVNGMVYDVTGSAAWAAGTHFGLRAGNDLTDQFSSCHLQNDILSRLPIVGILIQPVGI